MSDEMKVQTKGFNKKFIFIAITIIVVGLIAVLVFVPRSAKAKKVEEQLNLGAKYLSELDYEQAIVAYEAVIKIDPKCEEAYLALADVYIATGEFAKAEEVLKRAEEELGELSQAVEAKKQEVLTEKKSAEPIQEPIPSPTGTPIPSPTELPTLAPTNTPVPTEVPTSTPTPTQTPEQESEVILPSPTSTPTPVPTKAPTATPTPTAVPAAEGSVRVELKLASDCFTYGNYEEKYVCTGLSEKGYKEFQKYGPANLVSITLPSVSDTGNVVEGFWSQEANGYGLREMITEDSAYVELVCPTSFVTYYGVCNESISEAYAHKLRNVVLNDGLETIGSYAFYECTGITEIKIPSSVKEIQYAAFSECSELQKVTLPESVTFFGGYAFSNCNKLHIDSFEMAGKNFESKVFQGVSIGTLKLSGPNTVVGYNMWENTKIGKIVIAEGVEELPSNVFSDCTTVSEVYIPSSVKKIGSYAFENCTGIKEMVLPSSVEEIEWSAFSGCSELQKITLPESITYYGGFTFSNCNKLHIDSFELAGKTFGRQEFWGVSIGTVTLSGEANVIDYNLWDGAKVEKIVIAEGIEELPSKVFSGCASVNEIHIPDSVKIIGSYAFENCTGIKELVVPASVTEVGWGAFLGCDDICIATSRGSAADAYANENGMMVRYE